MRNNDFRQWLYGDAEFAGVENAGVKNTVSHGYPDGAAFVLTVSLDYRGTCDCFYSLMCYAWSVDG